MANIDVYVYAWWLWAYFFQHVWSLYVRAHFGICNRPQTLFKLVLNLRVWRTFFQWIVQAIEIYHFTGGFTIPTPDDPASYYVYQQHARAIWDIYHGNIVGASGAIFGVVVAFATLYPDMELMIIFFPVPVKAKYLIPVYIAIEIWSSISPSPQDNVAHLAHLGGALMGFILIKIWRYR